MQQETLTVYGMKCEACDTLIQEALMALDGIAAVQADYQTGTVQVEFDPERVHLEQLEPVLNQEGFSTVEPLPSETEAIDSLSFWQLIVQFFRSLRT